MEEIAQNGGGGGSDLDRRLGRHWLRREAVHLDAICRHHPPFAAVPHEVWSDGLAGPPRLEGGDILVIGNGCVPIGGEWS